MDLVSIILCIMKKWKAALICSIIGGVLLLFMSPFIEPMVLGISAVIYIITFSVSLINFMNARKTGSMSIPSTNIEEQLNALQSLYDRGIISTEEYETRRAKIIDNL